MGYVISTFRIWQSCKLTCAIEIIDPINVDKQNIDYALSLFFIIYLMQLKESVKDILTPRHDDALLLRFLRGKTLSSSNSVQWLQRVTQCTQYSLHAYLFALACSSTRSKSHFGWRICKYCACHWFTRLRHCTWSNE